jgi:transposase-like protein
MKNPLRNVTEHNDMNLVKLVEQFSNEDKARQHLTELRWPTGVECPRCNSVRISPIKDRKQYSCNVCEYQFSVTSGTIFNDSHLPLWKWFLAIYLMTESKKGISACQMQRTLDVAYRTAWFLCHCVGTYHKVSVKHLDAYLGELEHRFNNRQNKFLFRDTLLKLVDAKKLTYQELTKAA